MSDFDNFWYEYSRENWPSNDHLISYFSERLFFLYLYEIRVSTLEQYFPNVFIFIKPKH